MLHLMSFFWHKISHIILNKSALMNFFLFFFGFGVSLRGLKKKSQISSQARLLYNYHIKRLLFYTQQTWSIISIHFGFCTSLPDEYQSSVIFLSIYSWENYHFFCHLSFFLRSSGNCVDKSTDAELNAESSLNSKHGINVPKCCPIQVKGPVGKL